MEKYEKQRELAAEEPVRKTKRSKAQDRKSYAFGACATVIFLLLLMLCIPYDSSSKTPPKEPNKANSSSTASEEKS